MKKIIKYTGVITLALLCGFILYYRNKYSADIDNDGTKNTNSIYINDKDNLIAFLYISDFVEDIDVPDEKDEFETYVFLKDGRLLFSDERDVYLAGDEELDTWCRDEEFGDKFVVIKENVDDISDMYATFLDVMKEGTNDLHPDISLEWDVKDESWYGIIYTEDNRPEKVKLFRRNGNLYINNEERVNDIVKWMDWNMSLASKKMR